MVLMVSTPQDASFRGIPLEQGLRLFHLILAAVIKDDFRGIPLEQG